MFSFPREDNKNIRCRLDGLNIVLALDGVDIASTTHIRQIVHFRTHSGKLFGCGPIHLIFKMILNKIKFFEAHWSNRKKYEKIAGFVDGTQGLLGCRVISDGRINWWTYSPLVVVSTYWLLAIFTVCYHTSHNQLGKALPSLCLFGISISVCGISKKKKWINV